MDEEIEMILVPIDGTWTPVEKDDWENDPASVVDEVRHNREVLRLDDNDTAVEAEQLLQGAIYDDDALSVVAPKGVEQAESVTHGRTASVCSAYYHNVRTTPRARDALWCLNQILQHNGWERSDMTPTQGSCSRAIGASAGTHAGGDAGDLTPYNADKRVKYGRLIGFNIHLRPYIRRVWARHIHWTLLKSRTVSRAAQHQNDVWYARYGNGLANNGRASGFLPRSRVIKFEKKEVKRWYAKKATAGYAEPGRYNKIVDRPKGWDFEAIGIVSINEVKYLFNNRPTFYALDDFSGTPQTPTPTPEPAKDVVDTNKYEVTANPSLWGHTTPGLGVENRAGTLPKGTIITATHSRIVDGEKWIRNTAGFWFHSYYLKVVEEPVTPPTTEPETPEAPPEHYPIEPFAGEWKVVVDSKWGTDGPGGPNKYERTKGYHLFTTQKAIVDNVVYYISAWNTWYSADGLLPWDVPETPTPTPEPTTKFTVKAGTQNIQRWRLGERNTSGHQPFHTGANYGRRMELLAKEVDKLGLDIVATQEAGTYADRDTLTKALTNATGNPWAGILHGDNGDITQSVHWNKDVYSLKKEGTISSVGSTHNKHTYVRLQNKETGRHLWVVSVHLRYGDGRVWRNHRVAQAKDIVEGAWKLAGKEPILFLGDFNNYRTDNNAVPNAMWNNGYNRVTKVFTTKLNSLNNLKNPPEYKSRWFDNAYWHKSRKISKGGVHARMSGSRYATPFIADHNMIWGYFEA